MLLVAIVTGASADTKVLYSADFTSSAWTGKTFSQGNTTTPDVISGITFYSKNKDKQFSLTDNTTKGLTFPNNNINSSNYFFAIPLEGVDTKVYVTVVPLPTTDKKSRVKYDLKQTDDDPVVVYSSIGTGTDAQATTNGGNITFEVAVTKKNAVLYIGRYNSNAENLGILGITVSTEATETAENAPATPEFTPNGGDVNGGSKVSIASTDAQKIYYAWTNSATAPAQDAEETWTETTGDSYEFTIPNVTANMYLHAYGWNNYNTSSTSSTNTAAFNVTKVKQAAGLAYATTAVEKNIGAANFTNALTNPNELTITYSVVDGATATGVEVNANTGEVTVGNVAGTATIKASFAGNDDYLAGEATYTLTVVVPDPAIQSANVIIAKSATGGNIAFTVGYHSAYGGEVTASTTADWITFGDVTIDAYGAGTVAFTNDANPGFASRFANVTLTYTYNTNETKTTTLVVAQEANIVGTSIIKVPVQDATHAGEITGSIGGTATVALQTSATAVDGGYKFGQNGNYITITLADSKTFQEGDIFIVHTTKAADTNPGTLVILNGESETLLNTGTKGVLGINAFALPEATATISIKRTSSNNWNGYVDYIEVVRPNATISLNDGGSSFTKGFSTFCASANYTLTGATAYAATISDSKLIMTAIEGVIPANEGVVIAGDKNAEVTINYTTEAATTVTDNDLKGTTVAAKTADLKGTATKFLAFKKSTSTFTPYGGENFPANKAYLLLDSNNDSQSLEMVFDEATGINNVNAAETEAQAAPVKVIKNGKLYIGNYNVAGQQVK